MVFSADSVHLTLSLNCVKALLGSPVSVAVIHATCGLHYRVHSFEQLVIVTLDSGLSVLLNLRKREAKYLILRIET